jgi:diguanylate cyclase (GGDEF)-like protein
MITGFAALVGLFAMGVDFILDWETKASIRQNAEAKAHFWATEFFAKFPSASKIIAAGDTANSDWTQIQDTLAIADVFRFKLYNKTGELIFCSDKDFEAKASAPNTEALSVFKSGKPLILVKEREDTKRADLPETYVETYTPATTPDGQRIGVVEVYVDVSHVEETLEGAFQRVGRYLILSTAILLAVPASAFVFRSRQLMQKDRQLLELTRFDQATGVLNRNSVSEVLRASFAPNAEHENIGILFIDIDHFKTVNDRHGHICGDQLLKYIADHIVGCTRQDNDTVGRYGGDEFIVLCPGVNPAGLRRICERIMSITEAPWEDAPAPIVPSLSIGAYVTGAEDTERSALHAADIAVYAAKHRGRGQVAEFTPDMIDTFERRETDSRS